MDEDDNDDGKPIRNDDIGLCNAIIPGYRPCPFSATKWSEDMITSDIEGWCTDHFPKNSDYRPLTREEVEVILIMRT